MTHRNKSHTTCQCYHLTSFAVLMRVKDINKNTAMVSMCAVRQIRDVLSRSVADAR